MVCGACVVKYYVDFLVLCLAGFAEFGFCVYFVRWVCLLDVLCGFVTCCWVLM